MCYCHHRNLVCTRTPCILGCRIHEDAEVLIPFNHGKSESPRGSRALSLGGTSTRGASTPEGPLGLPYLRVWWNWHLFSGILATCSRRPTNRTRWLWRICRLLMGSGRLSGKSSISSSKQLPEV